MSNISIRANKSNNIFSFTNQTSARFIPFFLSFPPYFQTHIRKDILFSFLSVPSPPVDQT